MALPWETKQRSAARELAMRIWLVFPGIPPSGSSIPASDIRTSSVVRTGAGDCGTALEGCGAALCKRLRTQFVSKEAGADCGIAVEAPKNSPLKASTE